MMTMAEPKPLVLIADDSPTDIDELDQVLMSDYRIELATDGAEALQLVQSGEKPDLILLEVGMHGMDSYEVCERLHANQRTQDIPVIFLTAKGEAEDQERGFIAGGVDYISRPFEFPVVRARIRTHIQLKRRAEALEELVSIDPLTGILNRRGFVQVLETEWKRASRGRYSLAVLMIDVDGFKASSNDHGHEAGDECLRKIAHALRRSLLRPQDFVARYGDGKFTAVLAVCDVKGARRVAEQLRASVEAANTAPPCAINGLRDHQRRAVSRDAKPEANPLGFS